MITLITVNFNGQRYLKSFFTSVFSLDFPQDELEVILVDNGSTDDSVFFVKSFFPRVKIIPNPINNYCIANNLGIKTAKGEYIALLNNDITLDRNWIKEILAPLTSDKRIGIAAGKVLLQDGRINSTGHIELPNSYWADRGFKERDAGQYDSPEELQSLSHTACLYRKSCLDDIGFLDEDFNMYLENVDMCLRARSKGWKLYYSPKAISHHIFHGTIGEDAVSHQYERSRLIFIAKHYPHKLAESLFGKGYFTAINNSRRKQDLFDILSVITLKLLKHHDNQAISRIAPDIYINLRKIMDFEKQHLLHDLDEERMRSSSIEKVIQERDYAIVQKDRMIEDLYALLNDLSQRSKEKEHIVQEIYNSQTYRILARPLWLFMDALKIIKTIFSSKKFHSFRCGRGDLCFAYFSAKNKIAKTGEKNRYDLKITNDGPFKQVVNLRIDIENEGSCHAYFAKRFVIHPYSSREISLDYDWNKEASFHTDNGIHCPDERWRGALEPLKFYSLSAVLFDVKANQLDSLKIFQKLES